MEIKYEEVLIHYFNQLERDILNDKVKPEGLTGYIVAIAEWWKEIEDKERWLENIYCLLLGLKKEIHGGAMLGNISSFGGVCDILSSITILTEKTGEFRKFNDSIKNLALPIFLTNLQVYKNELKSGNVRTEFYDLVNGISGVGMYYLSLKHRTKQEEVFLREIINYLIDIHCMSDFKIDGGGWLIKCENQLREEDMKIFSSGSIDLGMAHGLIGTAVFLAKAYSRGIVEEGQCNVIEDIIELYISLKRLNVGGILEWPSQLGKVEFTERRWEKDIRNNRISWCYGSIGILRGIYLVSKFINNNELENWAITNLLKISRLPFKAYKLDSPILCHGYAGVISIFNLLNREKKEKYLEKAIEKIMEKELSFYNKEYLYGFKNRGRIISDGKIEFREVEQYDLLNSATGVILTIYSVKHAESLWEQRLFIV